MAQNLDGIRLVASDLDGTLLKDGTTEVNGRMFGIIERLLDRGIMFFAASGRQYASLRTLFAPVADRIGYLCENGALVMWQGEVLAKRCLPHEKAMEISHAIMAHPECDVVMSGEGTSYVIEGDSSFVHLLEHEIKNHVTVVSRPEDIREPILKVVFHAREERRAALEAEFQGRFGAEYRVITSGAIWVDVVPTFANKGTALEEIGERLGIAPKQMLAFGDNENDREMLGFVGRPYLMGSCNPSMRDLLSRAASCASVEDELERLLRA